MANLDTPMGLQLVGKGGASGFNARVRPYYVPASYETAIFIGDPVVKTGTANTAVVRAVGAGEFDVGMLPEVNVATVGDTNAITGVCVGVAPTTRDSTVYRAADTEAIIFVCDDPDAEFEIQADGAIPATSIGLNAVLIATHSGSTSTGISGMELDTTSDPPAADGTNQLLILRQSPRIGNEPNLIHNKILVKIINHTEAQGNLGVGIS